MSNAFEITTDDVATVLEKHGVKKTPAEIETIHEELDHDMIENAALAYCDMDNQTTSAYDEIEDQLMESGVIPKGTKLFTTEGILDTFDDDPDFGDDGDVFVDDLDDSRLTDNFFDDEEDDED